MKNIFLGLLVSTVLLGSVHSSYGSVWAENPASKEETERFKKSTVYFVIPNYLINDQEEEFEAAIKKGWTYNQIEIINEKDFNKYSNEKYAAFFTLSYTLWNGSFSSLYFELWQKRIEKVKILGEKLVFGNLNLDITCQFRAKLYNSRGKEIDKLLNGKVPVTNFKPAILVAYLQHMSFCLNRTDKKILKDIENEELTKLTEDTLYITANLLQIFSPYKDCAEEDIVEKVMKLYPYPYKLISMDELESKLSSNPNFFYTLYFYNDTHFIIMKKDKFVYRSWDYSTMPNDTKKMIKRLVKIINKKVKD